MQRPCKMRHFAHTGRYRADLPARGKLVYKHFEPIEDNRGYSMSIDTSGGHPAMDYDEHEKTYKRFLSLCKWTVIVCAVILAGMALTLV